MGLSASQDGDDDLFMCEECTQGAHHCFACGIKGKDVIVKRGRKAVMGKGKKADVSAVQDGDDVVQDLTHDDVESEGGKETGTGGKEGGDEEKGGETEERDLDQVVSTSSSTLEGDDKGCDGLVMRCSHMWCGKYYHRDCAKKLPGSTVWELLIQFYYHLICVSSFVLLRVLLYHVVTVACRVVLVWRERD